MGETTSRRKHSKAVERTNERVPAPVTENIKQEPSRGALVPGASAPINVSTLASVESLRYTIERCAQRGKESAGRWRQQYLVTTVAYRVAKITIPFRRCKKKKKKRENKNKKKPEPHTCRTPRCFVPRVSRDFHGKRIAAYIRETNMKKKREEEKRERGSSMITDDAKEKRGGEERARGKIVIGRAPCESRHPVDN